MDINKLQQLKQKLALERDLAPIWEFYMDHFADHQEFVEIGEPVRNPFLEQIVPEICKEMFGRKMKIPPLLIIYIAEHHFFHSPLQVEGRPGGVIYFADISMGLLAVSEEFPVSSAVKYSRFSESLRMNVYDQHDRN